ncbi:MULTISPECIES: type II toxin-antitoxin system HigA family antitoxin [Enterobacteriaceae]|jgi:HTH-type transcriptional regulator/antitoxin HigA|uniref:helix-turn-helix domain-containing protein n=1 Tax=Enterobacteriaceae TaxID=543 RepID=UPI0011A6D09F|nr:MULTISPECIES: helix-turn-helix domain-containing protein [Enterobacteriaceae]
MTIAEAIKATEALTDAVPFLGRKPTERDYNDALEMVAELLINDPHNPLVNILCARITEYENTDPDLQAFAARMRAAPSEIGVLKTLINQYQLTLADLPEIGSKSMVSRVLKGERKLSLDHIKKLAARFNVSPALFLR